ncbi:metallophosphoesterase [Candidatus Woesearchaeota archaeon]|nr:metallophosphoesterase [Candidatus Woesearchaeota archaeon]MBW3017538.1 metallophosphoesterase [Candidatus Woesearchaeota archaeon]
MKIFAFVDLHGDAGVFKKVLAKIKKEKPDIVLCPGDLTVFGNQLDYFFKELNNLRLPVLVLHGNHETNELIDKASKKYPHIINLHEKHFHLGKVVFFGYGGGGFALTNPKFEPVGRKFELQLQKLKKMYEELKVVFMTHAPPHNTKLDEIHGSSAGCKTLRKFIEKFQPNLAICGHLHENEGKEDKIGKTRLVNPGWNGMFFDL